ncbi:hypothetical protein PVAP13_5KG182914 [Panicum virgatum]|uniref:Uncharacterized protein n=1 Tax=Panicum virgatum TaxID=38727 RepID=A0A8T0SIM3_PANVG|nr:hypothetical protein PVAP13_5KG182914 [Panicum virgatum]
MNQEKSYACCCLNLRVAAALALQRFAHTVAMPLC